MNTSASNYKIVGFSGMPRSGKDSLGEFFMQNGFYGVSFGDIIREFSFKRHADKPDPISIENMTETSNWLRTERGADAVLQIALERFEEARKETDYRGVAFISIRAPIEVDFILNHGGDLIWIQADDDIRYQRDISARRKGESDISKQEFLRQEALQWEPQPGIDPKVQMNMKYVKEHATIMFDNNGSFEEFKEKAKELVGKLSKA